MLINAAGSTTHLPSPLTTFVGRRREIAIVRQKLSSHRLITLTGLGGVGKTRLAVQVAGELRTAYPDGEWLVELDGLDGGDDRVERAVRLAVGDWRELGDRNALLLLDNCEQVRAECAEFVASLLRAGTGLRVLVTSRQPLGLIGEADVGIAPFDVPDADRPARPAHLEAYDAVRLLVDRADDVLPGFRITAENAEAIAAICRTTDGLPLAIELAATRLRALTAQQVAERLPRSRGRWTVTHELGPRRQRSEWDNVDWSYRLCGPKERLLWARLSVFADHFPLDAAEVVGGGGELDRSEVAEVVGSLVDKSVLLAAVSGPFASYRLPRAWRDFGAERLAERGEAAVVARRHRDWCEALLRRTSPRWRGPYPASVPVGIGGPPLSRRETQVAELVARGLTDREIAQRLSIARRTAESHVAHILVKLNLTRRAQVASWYTAHASQPRGQRGVHARLRSSTDAEPRAAVAP